MYTTLAPNVLELLLTGTVFSAIAVPINSKIAALYNRRLARKLLRT